MKHPLKTTPRLPVAATASVSPHGVPSSAERDAANDQGVSNVSQPRKWRAGKAGRRPTTVQRPRRDVMRFGCRANGSFGWGEGAAESAGVDGRAWSSEKNFL